MKPFLIWLWLAQGADVGTTVAALHRGCVERTYWSGNPTTIAAGKLGASVVLSWGAPRVKGGKVIVGVIAGAATAAAALNLRTLPKCSR
jgi:hypothetical protein